LSGEALLPMMAAIPTRKNATMLNLIRHGLARLLPRTRPEPPPQAWVIEDSSWHGSSFELARGLVVIEHAGPRAAAVAGSPPALHPPAA